MIKVKGGPENDNDRRLKKAMGLSAGKGPMSILPPSMRPKGPRAALPGDPVAIQSKTNIRKGDFDPEGPLKADDSESDSDFDLDEDDDAVLAALRAKRVAQLKAEASKKSEFTGLGHGSYTEIAQDGFLPSVTESKYAVCHFYHQDFESCKVADMHLQKLARKHLPTRFVKLDAEKSPFFIQKLQIRVLPTLVFFKDGIAVDRLVGFEELGGNNEFSTEKLERRIAVAGVILAKEHRKDGETEEEAEERMELERRRHNAIRVDKKGLATESAEFL